MTTTDSPPRPVRSDFRGYQLSTHGKVAREKDQYRHSRKGAFWASSSWSRRGGDQLPTVARWGAARDCVGCAMGCRLRALAGGHLLFLSGAGAGGVSPMSFSPPEGALSAENHAPSSLVAPRETQCATSATRWRPVALTAWWLTRSSSRMRPCWASPLLIAAQISRREC